MGGWARQLAALEVPAHVDLLSLHTVQLQSCVKGTVDPACVLVDVCWSWSVVYTGAESEPCL